MSRVKLITMDQFAEVIKTRLHNRADCFVLVTGLPGTGKSTFAIQLSRKVDTSFTVDKNVIFDPNPKSIVEKVTTLPHFSSVLFDEAMRALNKKKTMTMLNTFLNEFIALCRKEYKLLILCTPTIKQLDSGVVNDRAIYWIDIPERGYANVFTRKRHSSAEDPFGIKKNLIDKAIDRMFPGKSTLELTNQEMMEAYASIKDHYLCTIRFKALPKELEANYEEIAAKMRKEIKLPVEWGTRAKLTKMRLNKIVAHSYINHGETQQSIAAIMGCEQAYVSFCLKEEGVQRTDKK